MNSKNFKTMLWAATMMALPLSFISCDDAFAELDNPSPATPSNGSTPETPYASNEYKEGNWEAAALSFSRKTAPETPAVVADASTTQSWSGWYTVTGNVTIDADVNLSDDAYLILCDGATLTIKKQILGNNHSLKIYGQGESTGKLMVGVIPYADHAMNQLDKLQIHGGVVSLTSQDHVIDALGSTLMAFGGKLTVESTVAGSTAINAPGHMLYIYGGELVAKGKQIGIKASSVFVGNGKLWGHGETGTAVDGILSSMGVVFQFSDDGSWTDTPNPPQKYYVRTKDYNP